MGTSASEVINPSSAMPSSYAMPTPAHVAPNEGHVLHSTQATLKFAFGVVPIVAGADKFTNLLTNWEQYLNPIWMRVAPMSPVTCMHLIGVTEIIVGVLVFAKPRIGALVVMAWLVG